MRDVLSAVLGRVRTYGEADKAMAFQKCTEHRHYGSRQTRATGFAFTSLRLQSTPNSVHSRQSEVYGLQWQASNSIKRGQEQRREDGQPHAQTCRQTWQQTLLSLEDDDDDLRCMAEPLRMPMQIAARRIRCTLHSALSLNQFSYLDVSMTF